MQLSQEIPVEIECQKKLQTSSFGETKFEASIKIYSVSNFLYNFSTQPGATHNIDIASDLDSVDSREVGNICNQRFPRIVIVIVKLCLNEQCVIRLYYCCTFY